MPGTSAIGWSAPAIFKNEIFNRAGHLTSVSWFALTRHHITGPLTCRKKTDARCGSGNFIEITWCRVTQMPGIPDIYCAVRGWRTPLLPPHLVSCLLSFVSHILSPVSHLLSPVLSPLLPLWLVSCLLSHVSWVLSLVPRLLSPVSCLSSPVSSPCRPSPRLSSSIPGHPSSVFHFQSPNSGSGLWYSIACCSTP